MELNQGWKGMAAAAARIAGLRLLVVDDNPMNQQVARALLVREGAMVDVAGGGAAALRMAAAVAYDAILMDIQMPGMDGYACTRSLRATPANRATPVIAMTADVMSSDRAACLAAGMNDHVGKPIAIDSMVRAILRHCTQRMHDAAPLTRLATLPYGPDAGAIDLAPALERLGGNAELYVALAASYAGEAAQFIPALRSALPDAQAAANILHTFKNAAGTMGAAALQNCASDLEARLRAGRAVDAGKALAQLEALVVASASHLARVVQTLSAPTPPPGIMPAGPAPPLADLLRELGGLLEARNMGALAVLAKIEGAYGADLRDTLAPLSNFVSVLDFAKAGRECRKLLEVLV